MVAGPEKRTDNEQKDKKLPPIMKRATRVVTRLFPTPTRFTKISIIPRGRAGGYTMILQEDKYYMSKSRWRNTWFTCWAERGWPRSWPSNDISTGAQNDLEKASGWHEKMVTEYSMSNLGANDLWNGAG